MQNSARLLVNVALILTVGLAFYFIPISGSHVNASDVVPVESTRSSLEQPASGGAISIYQFAEKSGKDLYDEAVAVACLQGLINRNAPVVYVKSHTSQIPEYWLTLFKKEGKWLHGKEERTIRNIDELFQMAEKVVKGAVIWDPTVPATLNVATTIAGVESGIVMSPEFAEKHLEKWKLPVLKDLRGMFDGSETGSAKNDAYRWAVKNYVSKGRCDNHWLFMYEDSFFARERGDIAYVVVRDWAVQHGSFVLDLSPWGDEVPADDINQPLGTDKATYELVLEETYKQTAGKEMTELAGFFVFSKYANMPDHKSAHEPVPTEWESVYLMSPYNCYQNTVASNCFNQSFHSKAPVKGFKQNKKAKEKKLENKTYLCILMADYDSATPLYEFLHKFWDDPRRGEMPFIWGIDPNLVETYPDVIEHLYQTATSNDYFGADASAAGYMNPNRIRPEHMELFVQHNTKFYKQLDMTLSPMVLDWDEPSPAVKDAFTRFSPDGLATIVIDFHEGKGKHPAPHIWKGMPVMELHNGTAACLPPEPNSKHMSAHIPASDAGKTSFHFFRIVWTSPSDAIQTVELVKQMRPELDIEVLDPYTFFQLFQDYYGSGTDIMREKKYNQSLM